MGYRTYHTLTATKGDEDVTDEYISRAADICGVGVSVLYGASEAKWYDHDLDMLKLTAEFPDVLFRLEGHGEGDADIWVEWYTHGALLARWDAQVDIPEGPPGEGTDPRTQALGDIRDASVAYLVSSDPGAAQEFINLVLSTLDRPEVVEALRE